MVEIKLHDDEKEIVKVVNKHKYGINIGEVAEECNISRITAGRRLEFCARVGSIEEVIKSSKLKLYFPKPKCQ